VRGRHSGGTRGGAEERPADVLTKNLCGATASKDWTKEGSGGEISGPHGGDQVDFEKNALEAHEGGRKGERGKS